MNTVNTVQEGWAAQAQDMNKLFYTDNTVKGLSPGVTVDRVV